MEQEQDKKRKTVAFLTSTGIHLAILALFIFSMAWRAPNPPLPEFGIELNFGDSPAGSGDIQPETPTASEQEQVEEEPVEEQPVQPEQSQEIVPSTQESVVTVPQEEKPVTKVTPKPEEKKEEVKPAAKPAEEKGAQPQSQGDDKDKTGDKGNPEGKPDPKAAYTGTPGGGAGGDGIGFDMAGWAWADRLVVPELPANAEGRYVFKITCDEEGEITKIDAIERGPSPEVERILRAVIQKNSLYKTDGRDTPTESTGTITFVLRSK